MKKKKPTKINSLQDLYRIMSFPHAEINEKMTIEEARKIYKSTFSEEELREIANLYKNQ